MLTWTSNVVLEKLMKCRKVKQLGWLCESLYQMKERSRKRPDYNWFIRIG